MPEPVSEQELVDRLARAVSLFRDDALHTRDPYAIVGLAREIKSLIALARERGYQIKKHGSVYHLFPLEHVEMERDGYIESISGKTLREHVYFYLVNRREWHYKRGEFREGVRYEHACHNLLVWWRVENVSNSTKTLEFRD